MALILWDHRPSHPGLQVALNAAPSEANIHGLLELDGILETTSLKKNASKNTQELKNNYKVY